MSLNHLGEHRMLSFSNNKCFNDVYITNRVPLCVYFRRCLKLLRYHVLRESGICPPGSTQNRLANFKGDDVPGNFSSTLMFAHESQHRDSLSHSHRNESSDSLPSDLSTSKIRIFASGSCVRKALYLLQDLYDYYYNFYVLDPLFISQFLSQYSTDSGKFSASGSSGLTKESLGALNDDQLDDLLSSLFKADISTDTIRCVDDVWDFGTETEEPSGSVGESNLELLRKERFISSICITVYFSNFNKKR